MKKTVLSAAFLAIGVCGAFAQLSGSVNVEGQYVPLIIDTERLNVFPQGNRFELPAADVEYDFSGMVTDFRPGLLSMGTTGKLTDYPWQKRRGYIDFRLGSWLRSRLDAGVAILSDSRQQLNVSLGFESSTLYKVKDIPENYTQPGRKRLYDGNIGFSYSRLAGSEGLLTAGIDYRLGYFNYYGTSLPLSEAPRYFPTPTQTLNRLGASVGYSSTPNFVRGWHASAAVDYFAYREGSRETNLDVSGGYNFAAGDNGAIAVDVDGDFIFLAHNNEPEYFTPRNYGVVALKPSYRLATNGVKLQAGLNLAASYDAMGTTPVENFGSVHIAPDVTFAYSGNGVGVTLSATGGVTPLTLGLREEFDRYQMPYVLTTLPLYTPVDARLGISAGPFAGFQGEASLRYAVARNTPIGGWYQVFLGCPGYSGGSGYSVGAYDSNINLHGLGVGLDLRYSYGKRVELEFEGSYTPQHGEKGIFNGYDRPRWILSAKAGVRPLDRLLVEVGYDYRGVRNILYPVAGGPTPDSPKFASWRLADITNLNARVSYRLFDNFSLYCNASNLLNRHVDLLPGLQSEGIVIQGGFYWEL